MWRPNWYWRYRTKSRRCFILIPYGVTNLPDTKAELSAKASSSSQRQKKEIEKLRVHNFLIHFIRLLTIDGVVGLNYFIPFCFTDGGFKIKVCCFPLTEGLYLRKETKPSSNDRQQNSELQTEMTEVHGGFIFCCIPRIILIKSLMFCV